MKYPPDQHDPNDTLEDKVLEDDEFEDRALHVIDFNNLRNTPRQTTRSTSIIGLLLILIAIGYLLSYISVSFTRYGHTLKVNVILLISDGMGPGSATFAREFVQYLHQSNHLSAQAGARWEFPAGFDGKLGIGQGGFGKLPLDALLVGSSRTRSSNSLVTDSAAGATAFSCGIKTYNGGIAVEPVGRNPCATVLEAAKHKGYLTGLVATSRLTHATPATFYAHVVDRDMETEIANMLVASHPLGLQVDFALGGGRCFFLPNTSSGSCRQDKLDPFADAPQYDRKGDAIRPKMVSSRQEFDALANDSSALGTFGLFSLDHMSYEIDRLREPAEVRQPSLKEMAAKALKTLSSSATTKSAHGFFLMIEGSRIDMAAHSNDPIAHLYDILAYQETVASIGGRQLNVTQFRSRNGRPFIGPEYLYFPDALVNATTSTLSLAARMASSMPASENQIQAWLAELGVDDPSEAEVRRVQEQSGQWSLDRVLSSIVSQRAQVGWSTHGHSGVDVGLYAYGHRAADLKGNIENCEIGSYIANVLSVDLDGTTDLLRRTAKAWHTKESTAKPAIGVQHFHGLDALSHGNTSSHLYLDEDTKVPAPRD